MPIGVDFDRIQAIGSEPAQAAEQRTGSWKRSAPTGDIIGVGVDRLDYTKGIPERLAALDRLFGMRPALRGRLTFVQIGVPSRSELESYSAIELEIDQIVESINQRHGMHGLAAADSSTGRSRCRSRRSSRSIASPASASSARCTTA